MLSGNRCALQGAARGRAAGRRRSFLGCAALSMAVRHRPTRRTSSCFSGYYFWTLRPNALLVAPGAILVLGGILRHTISRWLGRLIMPLLKHGVFAGANPGAVPGGLLRRDGLA